MGAACAMVRLCELTARFLSPKRHQTSWHASKDYGPHVCQVSRPETLCLQSCSGD